MKIFLLVLDGGGDVGKDTPYQTAVKPSMDLLAEEGTCGLLDIGYKTTPQSDVGYLNIMGFYSKENYPGRGYLEALGVGMEDIGEKDICIRGNFATMGKDGNLSDRRAGREEKGLEELAEVLDGTEIDGIQFLLRKSAGHRVVVVMRPLGEETELSDQIVSNDPNKTGVPVPQIKPGNRKAKFTASVLNKFVSRSHKILSEQAVNKEREFPANLILMRGFGRKKSVESFGERYGMKACCIGGIPIVKGVGTFLGMDIITVPGATGYPDTNLAGKFREAGEAFGKYDFVFLHINGTDILSHDKKRKEKAEFIEKIDRELGKLLESIDTKETVVVITSDHRTASEPSYPHYRHTKDPNPILVSGNGIKADGLKGFDEITCSKGFRIEGNGLMPFVLRMAGKWAGKGTESGHDYKPINSRPTIN